MLHTALPVLVVLPPARSPCVCWQENTSLSASASVMYELECCDTESDTISITDPLHRDVNGLIAFHALYGLAFHPIGYSSESCNISRFSFGDYRVRNAFCAFVTLAY